MAEKTSTGTRATSATAAHTFDEPTVEYQDETVPTVSNDTSAKDLKANLTFKEDADLHPTGAPDAPDDTPGGPPATEPNRPPMATNRPDTAIITSLATGSGEHTPPDPATVDRDGFVRPLRAEEDRGR